MHDDEIDQMDLDDLNAARGLLLGVWLGTCFWVIVGVAVWLS